MFFFSVEIGDVSFKDNNVKLEYGFNTQFWESLPTKFLYSNDNLNAMHIVYYIKR